MQKNYLTIIAIVFIASAFALFAFLYTAGQNAEVSQNVSEHSEALSRDHSVKLGNPSAKVTIVEFLDPACGTCRQFHPLIKDIMKQHGNKVNLVIRYAPLHQGSNQMVAILEAAKMQKEFWSVLDMMFETQHQWTVNHQAHPEIFWNHLTRTHKNLDFAKLQQDLNNPVVIKAIQQDVADGQRLGANKTPTFFVNGKSLPSFGYKQLKNLVQAEVNENY